MDIDRVQKSVYRIVHRQFKHWFKPNLPENYINDRLAKNHKNEKPWCEVYARTKRYHKSPIPYLNQLLNTDNPPLMTIGLMTAGLMTAPPVMIASAQMIVTWTGNHSYNMYE